MTLDDLQTGQKGIITRVRGRGVFRRRLMDMGFIRGKAVSVIKSAPLKDPVEFQIMDSFVSLRRAEARLIDVVQEGENAGRNPTDSQLTELGRSEENLTEPHFIFKRHHHHAHHHHHHPHDHDEKRIGAGFLKHRHFNPVWNFQAGVESLKAASQIRVALVGNPNCGKTSIFNLASNSKEHVGNYAGVTVDSKEADFRFHDRDFRLTDLPGTYSLTSFSPDELFVINHLLSEQPDVVLNVVDATNLERNLYLTTQLIDMDVPVVLALNMYDEFRQTGNELDYKMLGSLLGIPIIPTVGIQGKGVDKLFKKIIEVSDGRDKTARHIHIRYDPEIETAIRRLQDILWQMPDFSDRLSSRFLAIKLLEKNSSILDFLGLSREAGEVVELAEKEINRIQKLYHTDIDTLFADARYGFISGALKETLIRHEPVAGERTATTRIDAILTHKWLGFPIFLLFLWVMFQSTFNLGQYPVDWIDNGIHALSAWLQTAMPAGMVKDLVIDGIIGGVGGVLIFLPNILILFLFISLMEDTGYMARVAFIMDKLMHLIGLHGKSFIPLIMGFGCNVPAILATRTIENRGDRLLTMLILPLMSCSARLPVYILIAGVVFPENAGTVIFLLYLVGIAVSILMALLLRSTLFRKKEAPFVMELPPYRPPKLKAVGKHMWFRSQMYLKKMGGIILVASLVIWALGYFPRSEGTRTEQLEQSAIGHIGKAIQPAMAPLGFDWKMSVAVLSGVSAKEVVVSTMGILYQDGDPGSSQQERMMNSRHTGGKLFGEPVFTRKSAMALMLFVLIYIPCIAVLGAIRKESGSWKWSLFTIVYMTLLAWVVAWIGYQVM